LQLQMQSLQRSWKDVGCVDTDDRLGRKIASATLQTKRLAQLVDSLLDVTRIASGRFEFCPENFDMAQTVLDVAERFEAGAAANGCHIRVQAAVAMHGKWDRMSVEVILTNLVSNAVKYGPNGKIDVELSEEGASAIIKVRDHGIGIASDDTERIFARFERAVSKLNFCGLGLGLFVVRSLVEAHGGNIRVESKLGSGSTFTVCLPLQCAAPAHDNKTHQTRS
jgi:two-component system OmpR family sensor kinase